MTVEELSLTINKLTEAERLEVSRYINDVIFAKKKSPEPPTYTVDYLLESVKQSKQEIKDGKLLTHAQVLAGIQQKYGLSV